MGNANCTVRNDTNDEIKIFVFNYADGIRTWPRDEFWLKPGEERRAEAAAHGSGLIIATGKGRNGHHTSVGNGKELKVSDLLRKPGNQWYTACVVSACIGGGLAGVATGGLVGAQIGGAIASSGGAGAAGVAATGCSIGTGVTTGTAVGGTIAGIGIGAAWACSTHGKESLNIVKRSE